MNWQLGRQGTGYFKVKLFESRLLKCDAYLLKYPEGAYIPGHKDPVETGKHYRCNIFLKQAKDGGQFWADKKILDWPRIQIFRPDINTHGVSKVIKGTRYVLSFGFVK